MFAIITFRDTGPLKTWQAIRAANVHNARTKPLAHAMIDAPPPTHLIGRGDLEQDVKRLLRGAKLDPDRLRKNGVIAYEAILSASPAFFEQGTPEERSKRLADWTAAQVEWATARYKSFRIASMVLHVDEKTPHIHLVVLPLEVKADARCTDKEAMRWKLVGRTVSGPGQFDEAHDAYSAAMASFGLKRGMKGSGRKHEPIPVYLKRLAEKEAQVDQTKRQLDLDLVGVAADRNRNGRDRIALEAGLADLARAAAAAGVEQDRLASEAVALKQGYVAHLAKVAAHAQAEDERRRSLERDRHAMQADAAAERVRLADEQAALDEACVSHAARVAEDERRLAAGRDAVRSHLALLVTMEDELQHDLEEQRAETAAVKRAMDAAADLRQEAEADRVTAAAERMAVREIADHLNSHRDRLLPTLKAAHAFRQQVAALKDQPLTPLASSTRAAVDALARSSAAITPPTHELRLDILAQYAHIQRQGEHIRA